MWNDQRVRAHLLKSTLAAKYPHHDFRVHPKADGYEDCDAPNYMVTFVNLGVTIADPFTNHDGRFVADPQTVYNISIEDAEEIRRWNNVELS